MPININKESCLECICGNMFAGQEVAEAAGQAAEETGTEGNTRRHGDPEEGVPHTEGDHSQGSGRSLSGSGFILDLELMGRWQIADNF